MMFSLTSSFTTGQSAVKGIERDRQEDIFCHDSAYGYLVNHIMNGTTRLLVACYIDSLFRCLQCSASNFLHTEH